MATPLCTEGPQVSRPLANFLPSLWGNLFTTFSVDIKLRESYTKEVECLKEKVRTMFHDTQHYKIPEKINFINTVERLGVSYHFKTEIEALLHQMFDAHTKSQDDVQQFDLFTLGNYFRILRQHGYKISCDIFNKLKGDNGEFKDEILDDVIGMLSLYEASFLRTHGESILDEALVYTKARLGSMAGGCLSEFLENQVSYALNQPLYRGAPRIESRNYISFYEEDLNKNNVLLRFSKIDFNLLQMIHRQEMYDMSRWWKDLEFESKLPYARSRVVESYLWSLGVFYELKYSLGRIILAKVIQMITVVDDTYDAYGTPDELKVFTNAVERWDISAIDELPDYMKILYKALLNLYEEIEDEVLSKQENSCSYGVAYSREMFIEMVKGYQVENRWLAKKYVPSFQEYMKNGLVTGGSRLLVTTSLLGMGKADATIQAFEWVKSNPKMMTASNTITRLTGDIMSHEEEDEREHVATTVECYTKEHGLSREEVIIEFGKIKENAWKDINAEFTTRPSNLPLDVLLAVVNVTRVVEVIYKYDEGFTHPEKTFKNHITSLFIDHITI